MTTFAEAIMNLPPGTIVSLTLKGTGRVIIGAVVGPYTHDVMPSVLIDTKNGSDYPVVAIMLHTIVDGHEIGGMHSGVDAVPLSLVDETTADVVCPMHGCDIRICADDQVAECEQVRQGIR